MKTDVEVTKKIVLTLTEDEAKWLRSAMQNPLTNVHPDKENLTDRKNREIFFDALNGSLNYEN